MRKNLTYSIYYNQQEWYKLLIELERYSKKVFPFFLRLSFVRGPHIEFTEVASESEKIVRLKRFSEYFNIFLKNNPSKNSSLVSEPHGLFSDFPNNTIHYGIHDYLIRNPNSDVLEKVHTRISLLIMSILKAYKNQYIDFCDQIMLQLMLILGNIINQNDKDALIFIKSLLDAECEKFGKHSLDIVLEGSRVDFEENKKDFIGYCNEMIYKKLNLKEEWELRWHSLVNDVGSKTNDISYEFLIISLIDNISYRNRIYLFSLLNQGIMQIQKK